MKVVDGILSENCRAVFNLDYFSSQMPFIKKLRKLASLLLNDTFKLACLIEKGKIMTSLKAAFQELHFCVSDMGMEIIGSIVAVDEELVKVSW